ncbi:MAG: hypothetical protein ACOVMH_08885 [Flavobacterium sp.]
MFSNLLKLIFVATTYSPVLLIWYGVGVYNNKNFNHNFFIVPLFILLLLLCVILLLLSETKLTRNYIELKSVKNAEANIAPLMISYFLPCVELINKNKFFILVWIGILFFMIFIYKRSYFYNPLIMLLGYRYYEIATVKEFTYIMISRNKIINKNQVNAYSQLTDGVILNSSK